METEREKRQRTLARSQVYRGVVKSYSSTTVSFCSSHGRHTCVADKGVFDSTAGVLDPSELKMALLSLNLFTTQSDFERLFLELDTDNSGEVRTGTSLATKSVQYPKIQYYKTEQRGP